MNPACWLGHFGKSTQFRIAEVEKHCFKGEKDPEIRGLLILNVTLSKQCGITLKSQ